MKVEKDRSGLILLILGILLGVLVVYSIISINRYLDISRDDVFEKDDVGETDSVPKDDGQDEVPEQSFDWVTASRLFNIAFDKDVWISLDFKDGKDEKNYVFDEVKPRAIVDFLISNSEKSDWFEVCDSVYKEEFITKGYATIESDNNCYSYYIAIEYDKLMELSMKYFGKQYELNVSDGEFLYYDEDTDVVMLFKAGDIAWDPIMIDAYKINNYAYIVAKNRINDMIYTAKYEVVGDNYYIRSITKD